MRDIKQPSDLDLTKISPANSPAGEASRLRAMVAIGQLAGGVVHEINNLLMVLRGNLELIDDCDNKDELLRRVTAAVGASRNIDTLVQRLSEFSRDDGLWPEEVDLNAIARFSLERAAAELPGKLEIRSSFASDLWPVMADRDKAEQAILEMLRFACHPDGSTDIQFETGNVTASSIGATAGDSDYVRVSVIGHGTDRAADPRKNLSALRRQLIALGPAFGFARQSHGFVDADPKGNWVVLYLPRTNAGAGS